MYLSHFGLDRLPFDPAPLADDLFETPTHNEALAALVYGILENKGFVALSGEVGVGKTTVLRRALEYVAAADPTLKVVEIANPLLGPAALAARIHRALDLDLDLAAGPDLEPLRVALCALTADGGRLLLVIDEAQSLPPATLEFLRILSNLSGGGRALIQIVLSGQPELDATLDGGAQRALRQRIAVRARIAPLSRGQVVAYLRFRLARAGATPRAVLTGWAMRRIAAESGGFLRRVNVIADNALVIGFGAGSRPVGWRIVARALAALDDRRPGRRFGWPRGARVGLPAVAALLGLSIVGWSAMPPRIDGGGDVRAAAPPPVVAVSAPAAAPPAVITETIAPPVESARAESARVESAPAEFAPVEPAPSVPASAEALAPPPPHPAVASAVSDEIAAAPHLIGYRVERGDTLSIILRQHGLPADAATFALMRRINPALTDVDHVLVGQDIRLPDDASVARHTASR
jgi:general secretion pathway protein A